MTITTKKQLIDTFRSQIRTNPNQATKALLFMYNRYMESDGGDTKIKKSDISILCRIARHYITYKTLTTYQMECIMMILPKYATQIMTSSLERGLIRKEGKCYVW